MRRRAPLQFIAMVVVFTFCQVMGAMCVLPDLSDADETAILGKESTACPMDGTIMCPPSLTTSPERQIKNSLVVVVDPVLSLVGRAEVPAAVSFELIESWSNAYSIVPISISSSSVLRI
ncbi:MAG: hypothetical protein A4E19_05350 [Nitrospira sp. SG-bin1]|nr:MAG: hypothetical protein A4E19_05350 [Nitrospira sp. SG-bin1]